MLHDINFLNGNVMEHTRTGLCVGSGKNPFKIKEGYLSFYNEQCQILSVRALALYSNYVISALVIPSYIKEVRNCAFAYIDGLQVVKYMSSAPIPKRAFYQCVNLKDVYIYGKVKKISATAFTEICIWKRQFDEFKRIDITLHAKKGSYVEKYAKKYNFKFKELNANDFCFKNFDNSFYYHLEGERLKEIREDQNKYRREHINYDINSKKHLERLRRNPIYKDL